VLEKRSALEEPSDFISAEHVRELARLAGHRHIEVGLGSAEGPVIKEAQGDGCNVAGAGRALLLKMKIEEVGLEFFV
jgi:hypothetical protein